MTLKPNGFRALGVETLRLTNSSQKGYEAKLAILLIRTNFSLFDVNTHCLMRQEVRLLSEKLNLIFFFFNSMPRLFIQYVIQQNSKH